MKKHFVLLGLIHAGWVLLLAFCFAMTEIQIEGANGWAASLPTWRVENGELLGIFWGGRPLTGYHAWLFTFMALAFHGPMVLSWRFEFALWLRTLGSLMLFWIAEDFIWFALNPAFGVSRLDPSVVPWHKSWFWGLPADYTTFSLLGAALILISIRLKRVKGGNENPKVERGEKGDNLGLSKGFGIK